MAQPTGNALNWFFIPVVDLERATAFYSDILELTFLPGPSGPGFQMVMFPQREGGRGVLIQGEDYTPSQQGVVIYLNGGNDLSAVLNRVAAAGGKALSEKTDLGDGNGFIAYFEDTEGNKVGLHSVG